MVNSRLINRAEFAALAGVSSAAITKACKGTLQPAAVGKRIDANHSAAIKYLQSREPDEIPATGFDPLYEDAVQLCRGLGRYSQRAVRKHLKVGSARAKLIVDLMTAAKIIPEPGEPPPIIQQAPKPQRIIKGHTAKNNTKKDASLAKLHTAELVQHEIPDNLKSFADMTLRELVERFGTDVAFLDWLKAVERLEIIETKKLKNATTAGKLVNRDVIRIGVIEPINNAHVQLLTDGAKTLALKTDAMSKAGEDLVEIEKIVVEQMSSFIRPVKAKIARALRNA